MDDLLIDPDLLRRLRDQLLRGGTLADGDLAIVSAALSGAAARADVDSVARRRRRDRAVAELGAQHFDRASRRATAAAISEFLDRYSTTGWLHDRALPLNPYPARQPEHCAWIILRASYPRSEADSGDQPPARGVVREARKLPAKLPSASQVRAIVSAGSGQRNF